MTLTLTSEKKERIKKLAKVLLTKNITIRMLGSFVGNLTASFEAVPYGRLKSKSNQIKKSFLIK